MYRLSLFIGSRDEEVGVIILIPDRYLGTTMTSETNAEFDMSLADHSSHHLHD
jgi:hypothetical protein